MRSRLIGLSAALIVLLIVVGILMSVDGVLVMALIDEPWSVRRLVDDPGRWADQARCRHEQRSEGQSDYTIACVCYQVHRASSGAGVWSTMPGCLNP
jgi:hypothetical protein